MKNGSGHLRYFPGNTPAEKSFFVNVHLVLECEARGSEVYCKVSGLLLVLTLASSYLSSNKVTRHLLWITSPPTSGAADLVSSF